MEIIIPDWPELVVSEDAELKVAQEGVYRLKIRLHVIFLFLEISHHCLRFKISTLTGKIGKIIITDWVKRCRGIIIYMLHVLSQDS